MHSPQSLDKDVKGNNNDNNNIILKTDSRNEWSTADADAFAFNS